MRGDLSPSYLSYLLRMGDAPRRGDPAPIPSALGSISHARRLELTFYHKCRVYNPLTLLLLSGFIMVGAMCFIGTPCQFEDSYYLRPIWYRSGHRV